MRKIIILTTFGCVLLSVCIFRFIRFERTDYWKTIGVTDSGLYTDLKKDKGNPDSIETFENGAYVVYDGIKFYYANRDLTGSFLRAEIYSDKYSFGKQKIAIGTSKDVIILSYKNAKAISGLPDGELAYECCDDTIIWFEFNESNFVEKIILTWEL